MFPSYQKIFSVTFRHSYFKSEMASCIQAYPCNETRHILYKSGLLFRANPSGFTVYGETGDSEAQMLLQDQCDQVLRFYLSMNDPYFYLYTEPLVSDLRHQFFYFTNKKGRILLHDNNFVTADDAILVKDQQFLLLQKPFALLEIAPEQLDRHTA